MNPDDLTPERLDAVLNGSQAPTEDADREMLALAAELRGAAPGAGDELRERVRAIVAQAPERADARRGNPGWRSRLLLAGPALATLVAAIVVIAVVGGDSGTKQTDLASSEPTVTSTAARAGVTDSRAKAPSEAVQAAPSATPPAALTAGPVILRVGSGTLARRVADARRIVTRAGGTVAATPQATAQPGTLLTITLPPAHAAEVIAQLSALGEVTGGTLATAAGGSLNLLLTEAP
jgi:hypothetical protein